MLIWSWAVVVATVLAADLPAEALIERLGSLDRVVREEAARTLEELGTDALPALRAARDKVADAEARRGLADLIARVETRLLDRPTLVALDFEDRPLGEAIEALSARSGFSLALDDPALAGRRVTAHAADPLPFWDALDRLGRAGHVRHDPSPRRTIDGKEPQAATIRLVDGDPPAFTAYSGPVRVQLFATHWHRDITFGSIARPRAESYRTTVTADVQGFAEPGRFLDPAGPPRLEVVDDQGKALTPPLGGGDWPNAAERSWLTPGRLSLLQWHVPLGLPDRPGRMPLKLRGVLPVVISVRRPDPLVIPLADAVGKTFRLDGSVVRVERSSINNPRIATLILVLSDDAAEADRGRVSSGPQTDHLSELVRNRLEFEDAQGRPLGWLLIGRPLPSTSGELRAQVRLSDPAPAARLRVYRLNRLAVEIPFAVDQVPAP